MNVKISGASFTLTRIPEAAITVFTGQSFSLNCSSNTGTVKWIHSADLDIFDGYSHVAPGFSIDLEIDLLVSTANSSYCSTYTCSQLIGSSPDLASSLVVVYGEFDKLLA